MTQAHQDLADLCIATFIGLTAQSNSLENGKEMVIVLMGVAGSGKSTVGQVLADRLGWRFQDADDFHPPHNREKMRRGIPLDDNDRGPWLQAIRTSIVASLTSNQNAIYACSALKQVYRHFLKVDEDVKFVYLKGPAALIAQRLAKRKGHFFDRALLQTQFNDLEEPRDVFDVDISSPPNVIADLIIAGLGLRQANISR
jgi:gluconokinase